MKTGAAVIPVGIYTSGFARWRLVAGTEVSYDSEKPNQLTADINRALEAQIRESPADWFWVHNRWKMPHPQFLLGRTKRGLHLPPDYDRANLRPFRILIRSSDSPGDAVLNSPAVRAIKQGRPRCEGDHPCAEKNSPISGAPCRKWTISLRFGEDANVLKVALRIRGRFDVAVLFFRFLPERPRGLAGRHLPPA